MSFAGIDADKFKELISQKDQEEIGQGIADEIDKQILDELLEDIRDLADRVDDSIVDDSTLFNPKGL